MFSETCPLVALLVVLFLLMSARAAFAQGTAFNYQGRLQDGGTPANGSYDLQFTLWDSSSGGTQQPQPSPSTVTKTSVAVANGVFTVQLDFGANAFPGANRYLEISVRLAGGGAFTILSPRQPVTGTPYAIRSASAGTADTATNATNATTATNATQLGGVAASQYVITTDPRLSAANYIQNTTSQQSASNFNISGNGIVGGRMGIATTSPGSLLALGVDAGATQYLSGQFQAVNTAAATSKIDFGGGEVSGGNTVFRAGMEARQIWNSQFTDTELGFSTTQGGVGGGERLTIKGNGNVGIGTTNPANGLLEVDTTGAVAVFGFSNAGSGVVGFSNIGVGVSGSSTVGSGVVAQSTSGPGVVAQSTSGYLVEGLNGSGTRKFHIDINGTYVMGSDFAEALPARGDRAAYEPGDVLVVSTSAPGHVEKASRPYDVRVAGIYSTRPGMLGADKNGTSRVDPDEVPVAIVGIVPAKVAAMNGPIRVGDLLTTSSIPGYAMRCTSRVKCVGAIVGKALEPLAGGKGVIKVLVMLR
jgi:hypothetical protein